MEDFIRRWIFDPTVGKLIIAVVGIVIVMILVRLLRRSTGHYVSDPGMRYRARKIISFIGYSAGVVFLASLYSSRLGGISVALGVAGAGIAFALQEVIASAAGWFAISFASFYKPGDRVELGGIKGDVIDIGLLRTTMMEIGQWIKGDLYTGRIVRIANSFVFKQPVFNFSGEFPFLWDEVTVPVKYGSDYGLAREIFLRVAQEVVGDYSEGAIAAWKNMVRHYLIEDARVAPAVTLVANDNWVEFTIRYVVDYKKRRITKDQLFTKILGEVEQTRGRVAIASATFQIVETPVFDVRMAGSEGIKQETEPAD